MSSDDADLSAVGEGVGFNINDTGGDSNGIVTAGDGIERVCAARVGTASGERRDTFVGVEFENEPSRIRFDPALRSTPSDAVELLRYGVCALEDDALWLINEAGGMSCGRRDELLIFDRPDGVGEGARVVLLDPYECRDVA